MFSGGPPENMNIDINLEQGEGFLSLPGVSPDPSFSLMGAY